MERHFSFRPRSGAAWGRTDRSGQGGPQPVGPRPVALGQRGDPSSVPAYQLAILSLGGTLANRQTVSSEDPHAGFGIDPARR